MLLDDGPKVIYFTLEATMNSPDLSQYRQRVRIRLEIIPFMRFGSATHNKHVISVAEYVGLSTIAIEIRDFRDTSRIRDMRHHIRGKICESRNFGEEERQFNPMD
jgi:hypothetical protein